MQDGLQAMVARIDERTEHIQEDVKDLKNTCEGLTQTINCHSQELACIETEIGKNHGLSRRQTAGIGAGAGALIGGAIAFLIDFFSH